jgi:hypothetical protein
MSASLVLSLLRYIKRLERESFVIFCYSRNHEQLHEVMKSIVQFCRTN